MEPSCGTKKVFITLAEVRAKWTGVRAGMTSLFKLAMPWSG